MKEGGKSKPVARGNVVELGIRNLTLGNRLIALFPYS